MLDSWKGESRAGVVGLTLLRMVTGVILAAHGWEKLIGYQEWHAQVVQLGIPFPDVAAPLAIAAELGGGVGLVVGLLTRLAAFGAAFNMGVAIATVHFSHGLFARDNGFEYPLLLLVSCLYFVLRGAGAVSLDALWSRPGGRVVTDSAHSPSGHYPANPARRERYSQRMT